MDNQEQHNQIMFKLGEITSKLETLPKIEKHLEVLNGRVDKLEDFNVGLKAKVGVISVIVGGAIGLVGFVIISIFKL